MNIIYEDPKLIRQFIKSAFEEDVRDGDHSSLACIPAAAKRRARLILKKSGVLAGVEMAREIFKFYDPSIEMDIRIHDGERIRKGQIAFYVEGSARSILTCERLALNCMQRMSGIATYTNKLKKLIRHPKTRLLDTRKTTPNFRICEKWAVKIGGGTNHRFGLYDMVMWKDNHIDYAGGIREAITKTKTYLEEKDLTLKIEVETRDLDEVKQVLAVGGIDRILLDNMTIEDMKTAVDLIGDSCETEASGGINEKTIGPISECGVDFISVGALTHQIKSLDMSLKAY